MESVLESSLLRSWRVGPIEIVPLWDGPLPSSIKKIPDAQQRSDAEALVEAATDDPLSMNVYGFLIKSGSRYSLIDVGSGRFVNADCGKLGSALAAAGVSPENIERVFLTHCHRDHFGGLVTGANDEVVFKNAEIVLRREEASFWLDNEEADVPARAKRYFAMTQAIFAKYRDRIRRVGLDEAIGGISAVASPGHTPGHTCWNVDCGARSILVWGDLIHIAAIHLPRPDIIMEYDLDPLLAIESRRKVLASVADTDTLIAGAHLPAPGLGRILTAGAGYRFEPAK